MSQFCEENNIKQVFGLSYYPKSNALCEATNGVIRNILCHLFIKNGNKNGVIIYQLFLNPLMIQLQNLQSDHALRFIWKASILTAFIVRI